MSDTTDVDLDQLYVLSAYACQCNVPDELCLQSIRTESNLNRQHPVYYSMYLPITRLLRICTRSVSTPVPGAKLMVTQLYTSVLTSYFVHDTFLCLQFI
jgi:hypothetical protein